MENKRKEEIIKKWEESGLLDGLTEMGKDHPMLKAIAIESIGKRVINEFPDIKPKVETEHLNVSDFNGGKDYVEEIYVVRDKDADGALQPIISGNLIIKTKSGKTYKVGVKDL